jgi:ABC-type transport system involved in multi-copper enzyme maturation permease subunit
MIPLYIVTLKQLLRQSNLWYINIFAIASSEIAPAFAELFTFGEQEIAVIESVKASVYMSIILSSIFCVYKLMSKELNRHVAINIFSKPIEFKTFILAKYCSMLTVIGILCLFQSLWLLKHAWYLGWSYGGVKIAFSSLYGIYLQGACIMAFAMILSVYFNKVLSLSILISILFIPYMLPNEVLAGVSFILPALSWFDFSEMIYKNIQISATYLLYLTAYTIVFVSTCILIAEKLLQKREF